MTEELEYIYSILYMLVIIEEIFSELKRLSGEEFYFIITGSSFVKDFLMYKDFSYP